MQDPGPLAPAVGLAPDQLDMGFRIRIPEKPLATYILPDGRRMTPTMAITRTDNDSGSVTLPSETVPRIIQRLQAFGGAARFGEMFTTPRGNDLVLPNLDDTANTGEQRVDQDTALTALDLEDIGSQTFKAYTYSSKSISISYEADQDSIPTLINVIQDIAGRRIGRIRNLRLTKGTGTKMPLGIAVCAGTGLTTAASHVTTAGEIVSLLYSLDEAYLEGEGDPLGFNTEAGGGMVGFMIARDIEKYLVTLADTAGRPLWLPSIQSPLGGMIYGHPYIKNYAMDALTVDSGVTIVFGNGNYYGIRQVQDIAFFRFFDSATALGAGKLTVQFVGVARGDGQPRGGFSAANVTEAFKKLVTKA